MGGLGELASKLDKAARDLRENACRESAEACGEKFLEQLQRNTPVKSGELRDMEYKTVTGGGDSAAATVPTDTPAYASFREHGGEITTKNSRVLTDGTDYFGTHVFQAGSFYMARTVRWAEAGALDDTVRQIVQRILRDAGL